MSKQKMKISIEVNFETVPEELELAYRGALRSWIIEVTKMNSNQEEAPGHEYISTEKQEK